MLTRHVTVISSEMSSFNILRHPRDDMPLNKPSLSFRHIQAQINAFIKQTSSIRPFTDVEARIEPFDDDDPVVRVYRDRIGGWVLQGMVERRRSDQHTIRDWSAQSPDKGEIRGPIERPVDTPPVVCELRIGKRVELGSGEVPAVEAYEGCPGVAGLGC